VAQDGGQFLPTVRSGFRESNAQAPDLALSDESGSIDATSKVGEESPGLLEKRLTSLCEAHAPLQSLKERASQLFLELPHLARQGGLHDVQPLGRSAEMLFLAHGDEVSKVSQFHKDPDSGKLSGL